MIALRHFIALVAFCVTPALAQEAAPVPTLPSEGGAGDLLVAPTRIVLEGRTRTTEVMLNNKSAKEATYRISFTHLRMDEKGAYKDLTEAEARSTLKIADDLVRFSPKQVSLKSGESQVVKVMVRKPENLADGEYISHLLFRAVPELATGEDVEAASKPKDGISIQLIPVYGVSIPVIVRQGELTATAKITGAARAGEAVNVTLARSGNRSVSGDILITQGSEVVGQARGVNLLAYVDKREISVPVKAGAGPLTVEYRESSESGGKTLDKIEIK